MIKLTLKIEDHVIMKKSSVSFDGGKYYALLGDNMSARMIHGYVAKIHDNPSDEEFSDYGGTIDVGEYPDETARIYYRNEELYGRESDGDY